jgi:L-2-hydroxyglutarate oxidase LhgO
VQTLTTEAVVIGAGVVGLAIARALALAGRETVVLESAGRIGVETSSRNSGVIHAGIYYPAGSLKAQLCLRGKKLLYEYLRQRSLPHSRCGKLIVAATQADTEKLELIANRAVQVGVDDLRWLSTQSLAEFEPHVRASVGLFSPSTGIIDGHQFMLSLLGELEAAGGVIAYRSPVISGQLASRGLHLVNVGGETPVTMRCQILVNASGLYARDTLIKLTEKGRGFDLPQQQYAKGHYYSYSGDSPFSHLVYPLPEAGGLGVHATLDLAGQLKFGPDVCWQDAIDYSFDESRRDIFESAIKKYYPGLDPRRLQPAYTGIRPKIAGPETADPDFLILAPPGHGYQGFYSLHGIESPGLTAALAIAEGLVEM